MLKVYRRGGVVGRWNSERYWGRRRFLEELRMAALAEDFGVSTAEVLALIMEPAGLGSVRAWLVARYLPGVRPLHEYFGDPVGGHIFYAAGKVVRRMHEAGIDHHDLHVGNIMVSSEADGAHAYIVDWDRARARAVDSWSPYANLIRLWRSVQKGRLMNSRFLHESIRAFIRGYFGKRPDAFREARRYFRRRAVFLGMRRWFWRASR
jgi:3-deoxy-D-manno-octulosonic acid kinase